MSGGSAGTSCTNPVPEFRAEARQVDANFSFAVRGATTSQVYRDSWPTPAMAGAQR